MGSFPYLANFRIYLGCFSSHLSFKHAPSRFPCHSLAGVSCPGSVWDKPVVIYFFSTWATCPIRFFSLWTPPLRSSIVLIVLPPLIAQYDCGSPVSYSTFEFPTLGGVLQCLIPALPPPANNLPNRWGKETLCHCTGTATKGTPPNRITGPVDPVPHGVFFEAFLFGSYVTFTEFFPVFSSLPLLDGLVFSLTTPNRLEAFF